MKIIVCVKQVPEVTEVQIDPKTNTLIREGVPSIINPFDEYAVEAALQLREIIGGEVIALSMGPPHAEEALKTCFAMGTDKAYLLCDKKLVGSDTLATSAALSAVISKIGFDIILCGQETIDSSTGQVGPEIAELLNIAQITFVNKIKIDKEKEKLIVYKETEEGYQIIECFMPILLTVVKGINIPRDPDYKNISQSVKIIDTSFTKMSEKDLGINGSPTQVFNITTATNKKRDGLIIDSSLSAQERLEIAMSGGIRNKENSLKINEDPSESAKIFIDFISRNFNEY